MDEDKREIYKIVAGQFCASVEELEKDNPTFGDLDADSLDAIEIVMSCEDCFEIEIDDSDPALSGFEKMRVGEFADHVLKLKAEA